MRLLYYLAAADVGHLEIIDFDSVELSNLNRQILYTEADVGRRAEAARDRLRQLNSEVTINAIDARVGADNIDDLLSHSGSVPVLGVSTSIAGSLGAGEVVTNGYLTFSVFSGRHDFIPAPRDPACPACGDNTQRPDTAPLPGAPAPITARQRAEAGVDAPKPPPTG